MKEEQRLLLDVEAIGAFCRELDKMPSLAREVAIRYLCDRYDVRLWASKPSSLRRQS